MKLLYDLNKENVWNDRIQKHLASLKTDALRNAYCKNILDKKSHLIRLKNQCNQLKLPFNYDLSHSLKNLDLIKLKTLRKAIESNLNAHRKNVTNGKINTPKLNKTKRKKKKRKPKKRFSIQPRISTQPAIEIKIKKKGAVVSKKKPKNKPPSPSKKTKGKRKTPWTIIISTPMYS